MCDNIAIQAIRNNEIIRRDFVILYMLLYEYE